MRRLLEFGVTELVGTSRVRGTVRHHYSLTPTARDGLRSLLAAADVEPHGPAVRRLNGSVESSCGKPG